VISGAAAPSNSPRPPAKRPARSAPSCSSQCSLPLRPNAAAQDALAKDLESIVFTDPIVPIAANVDARLITRGPRLPRLPHPPGHRPRRWVECIHSSSPRVPPTLSRSAPEKFSPASCARSDRNQKTLNVEDTASLRQDAFRSGRIVSQPKSKEQNSCKSTTS